MAKKTVRITSYNTHLFAGTAAQILPKLVYRDKERFTEIADRINKSKADVVGLCEVWADTWKRNFIDQTQDAYPFAVYTETSWTTMGDGLLILSKHPLFDPGFRRFKNLKGDDAKSAKGVLWASVYLDDAHQFRVFMSHTQSGRDETKARMSNLKEVKSEIDTRHKGTPAIVMGDLNVYASEHADLMKTLSGFSDGGVVDDVPTYDPTKNNLIDKFSKSKQPKRFDYILTTNGSLKPKSVQVIDSWKLPDGLDCSDHFPLCTQAVAAAANIPRNVYTKQTEAKAAAKAAKNQYGPGVSNLIRIRNGSKKLILRPALWYSWPNYGNFRYLLPASRVNPGQWTAAFHHHPDGEARGSIGCIIYRAFDKAGTALGDVFLGFETPWGATSNRVYVEVRGVGHWWKKGSRSYMYHMLDDRGTRKASDKKKLSGVSISVSGSIAKGTSPETIFAIS
ncbi:endonuclease/exonuclease/phosphatase family protein [uncultured Ruegeria sp.]|uniref:endonuclease/exonuclease/phosphatase family protein n=1 Tax=uncultured Ruegeria sp. TaxID=259304 RepID=UPI0026230C75|nr:endonuclease/exonuclease/phosphatase family protein [uncultured Ruegeria sp.]